MLSLRERFSRHPKKEKPLVRSSFKLKNPQGEEIPLFVGQAILVSSRNFKYILGVGSNSSEVVFLRPESDSRLDILIEKRDSEGVKQGFSTSNYHVKNGQGWFQRDFIPEDEKPADAHVPDVLAQIFSSDESGTEINIAGYRLSLNGHSVS